MHIVKAFFLIISLCSLIASLVAWKFLWNHFKGKQLVIIFLIIIGFWSATFYIKDLPRFKEGECFIIKNQKVNLQEEEWHKPTVIKDIEYQVLKVGKKNYLVHSSLPKLEDFLIIKDFLVTPSKCNLIYK